MTIDEETDHQIVHRRRCRKTNGAAHEPLDPGPQVDVFALDFLRMLFANLMLRWIKVPLVRPPPIGVKPCDAEGLQ